MLDGDDGERPCGNGLWDDRGGFRVMVGNEPLFYRDVMATALRDLRPEVEVLEVEPAALDGEVLRRRPQLVVCSELSEVVASRVPAWVLIYPAGANVAVISIAGRQITIPQVRFDDLLAAVDRALEIARPS